MGEARWRAHSWLARGVVQRLGRTAALCVVVAGCRGREVASASATDSGAATEASSPTGPKCAATPTQLLDTNSLLPPPDGGEVGISVAMDLAVSATDLYLAVSYGQNGALLSIPIRGGATVVRTPIIGQESALLVTGNSVVFTQSSSDGDGGYSYQVVTVGLQGGSGTVLASGIGWALDGALATDSQNVYFAADDGTRMVPLAGGAVTVLTTHTGSLAVVGPNLVIADTSAEGLFGVPLGGGPVTTLASNLSGDLGPVVGCGSDVCWASAVPVAADQEGTGALMQLGPTGPAVTLSQDPSLYAMYRLLFDGSEFFATAITDTSPGFLVRVPAAGGTPSQLGMGTGIAVDDECLYVGDPFDGVYSVARSYDGGL